MHHVRPLGATRGKRKVSPTELVPLCSNCHRMVHRRRDRMLTVKELTSILVKRRSVPRISKTYTR